MTDAAPAAAGKLPVKTKLAFGIGGMAETIALFSLSQYVVLYYNQVLGLSATLAGLAVTVSLLFDGFVDPVVGSLSDRTHSKLGRRHPYMFAAPFLIALSYVAIFNPPRGIGELGLFIWFAVSVSALRVTMAFFHTPHLALGGELSSNYTERSHIMAYNNFFVWAGGAGIAYVALTFFFNATPAYSRGLLNPAAYSPFSLFAAGTTLVILFVSAWFTRDQIPRLPKAAANLPRFSPFEFLKDLGKVLSNRNYVWLLVAYFSLSLMTGVRGVLSTYMATYFFELTSAQLRWYIVGSFAGYVFAFFASARLHGQYDKKAVMIWSAIASAIFPALPVMLRFAGIFYANGDSLLLPTLVAISAFSYGSGAILNITAMSALADVADENQARYGIRQEGVLYATRALFAKIDTAIGSLLAGIALDVVGFPKKAAPGHVDAAVLTHLGWIESPIAAIPGLIAVIFYARYKITHQTYKATRAKLDAVAAAPLGS